MNKQEIIKSTLRKLMESLSLGDITVQLICKESKINRQTFYYYYKDIKDVLVDYFLSEKIEGLDSSTNWSTLIHAILVYAGKNRQLILKALKSDSYSSVEKFFNDKLYKKGIKFIQEVYGKEMNKNDINEVGKLMSDSLSREMCRLLSNPQELSISAIEENISKTFDGVLDLICENKKKRSKKR